MLINIANVVYLILLAFKNETTRRDPINDEEINLAASIETLLRENTFMPPLQLKPKNVIWKSGSDALANALTLEHNVTQHIKSVMQVCENSARDAPSTDVVNDYHLVDYLTEFLGEQYKSMRDIAGKISTLRKMQQNEPLGEFLFDKQLQ